MNYYSFDGLHYTIEESMPSSTTKNYFSNNNTADQNLLVMTGEYIPVTSEAAQAMVQQIMKVVDKLDFSYHNPVPKAKDAILKWAKKLKPKTTKIRQNRIFLNSKNIGYIIGEMKDVEAKYFTFSPYATTARTVIGPEKVLSTVEIENKKRKFENGKVTKTYPSK
jgi:hypothetical protein